MFKSVSDFQVAPVQDEEENSFDPSEFFRHSSLANQIVAEEQTQEETPDEYIEQQPTVATDINTDLQVSESDSEGDEIDSNFNPLAGITNEEPTDDGFDIESFYTS